MAIDALHKSVLPRMNSTDTQVNSGYSPSVLNQFQKSIYNLSSSATRKIPDILSYAVAITFTGVSWVATGFPSSGIEVINKFAYVVLAASVGSYAGKFATQIINNSMLKYQQECVVTSKSPRCLILDCVTSSGSVFMPFTLAFASNGKKLFDQGYDIRYEVIDSLETLKTKLDQYSNIKVLWIYAHGTPSHMQVGSKDRFNLCDTDLFERISKVKAPDSIDILESCSTAGELDSGEENFASVFSRHVPQSRVYAGREDLSNSGTTIIEDGSAILRTWTRKNVTVVYQNGKVINPHF